jgi:phosphoglycolate phosphatase
MTGSLRYPTVLFDLDGTLTDPRVGITRGVQVALASVGIVVDDPDALVAYIGPPIHDGLAELHAVAPADIDPAVAVYRAYYREHGMYENELHEGVPELLARLTDAGAVLALATSKPDTVATDVLDHFGLLPWFRFVGGASLDGGRRTKADVIEHTLDAIGAASPASRPGTVIVGDRVHDIEGAKTAGIASIGVRWGYALPGELEAAGADTIVGTVDELRAALLRPG